MSERNMREMAHKEQKLYLPIIEITNGYKHYGIKNHWRTILRRFNLKTYPSQIYVLLGPNGCGKSTVLNIILGLTKLTQGQVQIFGFKPGHELSGIPGCRVGYIPQNDGLHMNFSIHELLRYYGALLGLSSAYVNDRMNFLTDLLNLPTEKIQVQFYTGNLRKQISIAIALLHEPEIIILDEPTAGVDPSLKAIIWKYLKDLIKKDERTIVVTSSDALEALQGDRMGIIRNGNMVMEGNPKTLLAKYKAGNVAELYEKVYTMNLSFLDEKDSVQENPLIQIEPLKTKSSEGFMYTEMLHDTEEVSHRRRDRTCSFREKTANMCHHIRLSLPNYRRLKSLMFRDVIFLVRSLVWLFMFLVLPALFLMIYGLTINLEPSNIAVAIVNKESKHCSDDSEFISCTILNKLDNYTLTKHFFDDEEQAKQKIDKLEMEALIVIGEKFSEGVKDDTKAHDGEEYMFKLHLDESIKITSDMVQTKVFNALLIYFNNEYKSPQNPNAYYFPLSVVSLFGDRRITFNHYIVLGMIVVLTYHMMAFITAYDIVDNKEKNIYQRDYISGAKLKEIIITRTVTYSFIVFIQTGLLFIVVMFVLKLPYTGQNNHVIIATGSIISIIVLQIWCGMVFGIFISTLFKQPVHALCCIACTMVAALTVEGIVWPEHDMPPWLRCIVYGLPHNRSAFTIRSLILRGTHMQNFIEWVGVIVPVSWIIVFSILFNIFKSY